MPIIERPISASGRALELVVIEADRHCLQKCRWRRKAADGVDFAFSLKEPLQHGDVVLETGSQRYLVQQLPEAVLATDVPLVADEAARIGWILGNLHQPIEVREGLIYVMDDPGVRRLLTEFDLAFRESFEIFSPPSHAAFHNHESLPGLELDHEHRFFGHGKAASY